MNSDDRALFSRYLHVQQNRIDANREERCLWRDLIAALLAAGCILFVVGFAVGKWVLPSIK